MDGVSLSACLCLACQRGLAALLASNSPPTHSPNA